LSRLRTITLALACASLAGAQNSGKPALTAGEKRLNIESFDLIWTTIRDQYWDPGFGGVNWSAVHEELRPKIETAATMQQARAIMGEMMARLGKSHFAIIPAGVYDDLDEGARAGTARPGVDVRVLEGHALVTTVDDGSPAAAQGVHPGWEILAIDGTNLAPGLNRIAEQYRGSTMREMFLARSVLAKLAGANGSKVQVQFLDGAGARAAKQIERTEPQGTLAGFGRLPPMHVWFASRKLEGGIGYIAFNLFLDPARLMPDFGDAVHACAACTGIVIDLRGNPGGLGIMAMGMAGWFIDKPDQRLGTMYMRQGPLKFFVNPRLPTYRGPLAILVDGCSASTSEVLAGGMKDLGRARVFGTRTAGAALPSAIDQLPNGDAFQHALADYVSEGGRTLEGEGVIPDVEVKLTREALLAGRDPVKEAAIEWIHARK
jgi:carboxyl-terminal processing protease